MPNFLTLLVPFLLVACSTTSRMSTEDLRNYRVNCRYKQEQIAFLRSQLGTQVDRQTDQLLISSTVGTVATMADGTYYERQARAQGWDRALIMSKLRYLESYCP